MKEVSTLLMVAFEAQERELLARKESTEAELERRLNVLSVLEDQYRTEAGDIIAALSGELSRVRSAKRASGIGVRAVSGLLS